MFYPFSKVFGKVSETLFLKVSWNFKNLTKNKFLLFSFKQSFWEVSENLFQKGYKNVNSAVIKKQVTKQKIIFYPFSKVFGKVSETLFSKRVSDKSLWLSLAGEHEILYNSAGVFVVIKALFGVELHTEEVTAVGEIADGFYNIFLGKGNDLKTFSEIF